MPLINLIITLVVVGVLLWLINAYIPMQPAIKEDPQRCRHHCRHSLAAVCLRCDRLDVWNASRLTDLCGPQPGLTSTRLRPPSLAAYRAWSARLTRSRRCSPSRCKATPKLAVTLP